jgi:hypothetical protein
VGRGRGRFYLKAALGRIDVGCNCGPVRSFAHKCGIRYSMYSRILPFSAAITQPIIEGCAVRPADRDEFLPVEPEKVVH